MLLNVDPMGWNWCNSECWKLRWCLRGNFSQMLKSILVQIYQYIKQWETHRHKVRYLSLGYRSNPKSFFHKEVFLLQSLPHLFEWFRLWYGILLESRMPRTSRLRAVVKIRTEFSNKTGNTFSSELKLIHGNRVIAMKLELQRVLELTQVGQELGTLQSRVVYFWPASQHEEANTDSSSRKPYFKFQTTFIIL